MAIECVPAKTRYASPAAPSAPLEYVSIDSHAVDPLVAQSW